MVRVIAITSSKIQEIMKEHSVEVLDRSPALRGFLEISFQEMGINNIHFSDLNLKSAQNVVSNFPDLIIIFGDLNDLGCQNVLNAFKSFGLSKKVLFITKWNNRDELVKGIALGVRAFISVPFQIPSILNLAKIIINN